MSQNAVQQQTESKPPRTTTRAKLSKKKRKAFLRVLEQTGQVGEAAQAVGYQSTNFLRRVYREDEVFAKEWDNAIEAAADLLEDEAVRRARDGVREPVYYRGTVVGHKLSFSDTLLMFLLKGARPDKFADRKKIEGSFTGKIGVALLPMTTTDENAWEDLAASVHKNQEAGKDIVDADFVEVD